MRLKFDGSVEVVKELLLRQLLVFLMELGDSLKPESLRTLRRRTKKNAPAATSMSLPVQPPMVPESAVHLQCSLGFLGHVIWEKWNAAAVLPAASQHSSRPPVESAVKVNRLQHEQRPVPFARLG